MGARPYGSGWDAGKVVFRSATPFQLQEANAQLAEQACPHDVEMTPVQRRIEPRSADDSLSGVVRCLYFADTFLRDGEARGGMGWGDGPPLAIEETDGRAEGVGPHLAEAGKHSGCLMCAGCVGNRVHPDSPLELLTVQGC